MTSRILTRTARTSTPRGINLLDDNTARTLNSEITAEHEAVQPAQEKPAAEPQPAAAPHLVRSQEVQKDQTGGAQKERTLTDSPMTTTAAPAEDFASALETFPTEAEEAVGEDRV